MSKKRRTHGIVPLDGQRLRLIDEEPDSSGYARDRDGRTITWWYWAVYADPVATTLTRTIQLGER